MVPSGLKLILGQTDPAFFQGPTYPNTTSTVKPPHLVCGDPDGGFDRGPGLDQADHVRGQLREDAVQRDDLLSSYGAQLRG